MGSSVIVDSLGFDKAALMVFNDGIFTIAITLLVLELRIPDIPSIQIDELFFPSLVNIFPKILGFVLSFFIITHYWLSFHRISSFIQSIDRTLVRLDIVFLFLSF